MTSDTRSTHLVTVAIVSLLLALIPVTASAQDDTQSTATWTGDWNGHQMTVTVVARGHAIPQRVRDDEPWWRWGNTSTDAYLFYWSDDRLVDLILDFSLEDGRPTARIYVPVLQKNRLGIQVGDGIYYMLEPMLPDIVLWPRVGDWLVDGLPNFNLAGTETDQVAGETRWAFAVGGENLGAPDWITRTMVADHDPGAGFPRFEAAVRKDPSVMYEMAQPLMPSWPYLSAIDRGDHYGEIHPLFFDPAGRVLIPNWAGFHVAGMYQINSISLPPETNFESPFAFYRFDPNAGLHPNLVIRSDIWPEDSPYGPPPYSEQRTSVRMTWTEEQSDLWRYSLTVTGNHPPNQEVIIGGTKVEAIPYEYLPSWVTSQSWKAATFVEATTGERGSEGIYEYSVEDNYPVSEWVNGLTSEPPTTVISDLEEDAAAVPTDSGSPNLTPYARYPAYHPQLIEVGFRGEYSMEYQRQPALYLSPIDNRVHLLNAQGGGWKWAEQRVLRVENRNGDPYIDTWIQEHVPVEWSATNDGTAIALPPKVEEALYVLDGYLLYSSDEVVELRTLDIPVTGRDVVIPTHKMDWERFLEESRAHDNQERPPDNLRRWLDSLPGDTLWVASGTASDVRYTDDGFRFSLHLRDQMESLAPGDYLVTGGEELTIVPLTPPNITGSLGPRRLTQLQATTLPIALRNNGLQDLNGATLEIWATLQGGDPILISEEPLEVLADVPLAHDFDWVPPAPGPWQVVAELYSSDGDLVFTDEVKMTVAPAPIVTTQDLLSDNAGLSQLAMGALALISFAFVAGMAGWRFLGAGSREWSDG